MLEQILTDLHTADPEWNVILLRYFNPIGAHKSGMIGEDPKGIPNNLLPYARRRWLLARENVWVSLAMIMIHRTGPVLRDYIHVVDLAVGHVKALKKLEEKAGVSVYNLGTGHGYSVLQVVHAFKKACGHAIKYEDQREKSGRSAMCYCDPEKAKRELGWEAQCWN